MSEEMTYIIKSELLEPNCLCANSTLIVNSTSYRKPTFFRNIIKYNCLTTI